MRLISLPQGLVTQVDDADYDDLMLHTWHVIPSRQSEQKWYAARTARIGNERSHIYMHRQIMRPPNGLGVDHKDGDGLNNQRHNLRFATPQQQMMNRVYPKESYDDHAFRGVIKKRSKWQARINLDGIQRSLGVFDTPEKAARAYDIAAREHHGEFAVLNFP